MRRSTIFAGSGGGGPWVCERTLQVPSSELHWEGDATRSTILFVIVLTMSSGCASVEYPAELSVDHTATLLVVPIQPPPRAPNDGPYFRVSVQHETVTRDDSRTGIRGLYVFRHRTSSSPRLTLAGIGKEEALSIFVSDSFVEDPYEHWTGHLSLVKSA